MPGYIVALFFVAEEFVIESFLYMYKYTSIFLP